MTALTFRILGYVAVALALAWATLVMFGPLAIPVGSDASSYYAGVYLGRLIILAPCGALLFTGLLMLAIGKALQLLDRIARNTEARAAA